MPKADNEAEEIFRFLPLRQGNFRSRGQAYQYTPYLAAMRRALCSSDSRAAFFVVFLVSVVAAGLVSVVVVVAAGAVAWTGAAAGAAGAWTWTGAASLAVVAAWARRTETWAIGFGASA